MNKRYKKLIAMTLIIFLSVAGLVLAVPKSSHAQSSHIEAPQRNYQVTQTPPALTTDDWLTRLDEQEKAWLVLGLEHYQLKSTYISAWNMVTATLVVDRGLVSYVLLDCQPSLIGQPCTVDVDFEDFTVEGLFEQARLAVNQSNGLWTTVDFDAQYHYPTFFHYDDPNVMDGFFGVQVNAFDTANTTFLEPDHVATATQLAIDLDQVPTPITTATPTASPTQTPDPIKPSMDGDIQTWIDEAEAHWDSLEISSYNLTANFYSAWTSMQVKIEMRNGYVTHMEATCDVGMINASAGNCWLPSFKAYDYSVQGLFRIARGIADMETSHEEPLQFHATYQFPTLLVFNEELMMDEEWSIRVVTFKSLMPN